MSEKSRPILLFQWSPICKPEADVTRAYWQEWACHHEYTWKEVELDSDGVEAKWQATKNIVEQLKQGKEVLNVDVDSLPLPAAQDVRPKMKEHHAIACPWIIPCPHAETMLASFVFWRPTGLPILEDALADNAAKEMTYPEQAALGRSLGMTMWGHRFALNSGDPEKMKLLCKLDRRWCWYEMRRDCKGIKPWVMHASVRRPRKVRALRRAIRQFWG